MFSVYPVPEYFGQGFTSSAYRVDLYTYQSCVCKSIFVIKKKKDSGTYTSTLNRNNSSSMVLGPPGCAQVFPLLEPGPPRFFWWYENSE
jgi:hypothetical protein